MLRVLLRRPTWHHPPMAPHFMAPHAHGAPLHGTTLHGGTIWLRGGLGCAPEVEARPKPSGTAGGLTRGLALPSPRGIRAGGRRWNRPQCDE